MSNIGLELGAMHARFRRSKRVIPQVKRMSMMDMFGEVTRTKDVNLSVFLDLIFQIWWKVRLRLSSSSRMSFSDMSESTDLITIESKVGFLVDGK